jgi:two-component system sensor histidine kinase KdpD
VTAPGPWLTWCAVATVATVALLPVRPLLSTGHVALVYLLVVLGASARGGRALGLALAVACFLAFNFLFLPPYYTLVIADPFDWLVLVAFLVTAAVAAELLHRAQAEAATARARAAEVSRLAEAARHAEALREADRLKDELLASVSHDLRTPLTTIKALAHDLAQSGDDRALTIEDEADRLAAFVTDLLDLSRLRAGHLALRVEDNEAEDLVGASLQRVAALSAGREVRASFDPSHPLLFARCDFVATTRILVNLLENALKYSPPSASVTLRVTREGDRIAVAVGDAGPGLAAGDADRLFAPFTRGSGTAPDTAGAGLGLAIARGLAEAQGGALAYAPAPSGGSVFTLTLPAAEPPAG